MSGIPSGSQGFGMWKSIAKGYEHSRVLSLSKLATGFIQAFGMTCGVAFSPFERLFHRCIIFLFSKKGPFPDMFQDLMVINHEIFILQDPCMIGKWRKPMLFYLCLTNL